MTPHHLTEHAIRTACDGDNMLHDRQSHPTNRSHTWTTLTRTDTRVGPGADARPALDPMPAERFSIWQAVAARKAVTA